MYDGCRVFPVRRAILSDEVRLVDVQRSPSYSGVVRRPQTGPAATTWAQSLLTHALLPHDYALHFTLIFSQPYLVRSRLCYSLTSVSWRGVCLSVFVVCTECIVAKRCVLKQNYYWQPIGKGRSADLTTSKNALISLHWLRVPERIVFKVAVQTYRALHGNAPQYLRQFTPVADIPSRQRLRSRDRWRHVTPKCQTRDPNMLKVRYLENSWRCYLATLLIFTR